MSDKRERRGGCGEGRTGELLLPCLDTVLVDLDGVEAPLEQVGDEECGHGRDDEQEEEDDHPDDRVSSRDERPLSRLVVDRQRPPELVLRRRSHVEVVGG